MTRLITSAEVRQVAERLARGLLAAGARRADREAAFPSGSVRAAAEVGLMGLAVPEELGGAGLGVSELVAATEVVASACPSTALIMLTHAAACHAIATAGTAALRRQLLPELASGRKLAGFAVHELSSGCLAAPIATRATRPGDGFRLDGRKPFVTAAGHADVFVVLAGFEDAGASLFVVDACLPGVSRGRPEAALGLRGAGVGELALDGCQLAPDALVGQGGDGLALVRGSLGTLGRFAAAGAALGIARSVRELAVEHVRSRASGGVALGERAPVVIAVAEIGLQVDAVDGVVASCLESAAREPSSGAAHAARAKVFATEHAVDVARAALQLAGGHGYFGASDLERCLRDALGLTIHLGPSPLLRDEIGRAEIRT